MKAEDNTQSSLLQGARVLVVDDDERICKIIASELQEEGAVVDMAFSGEGALELTQSTEYHLVTTDVRMPGIDGIELMHRLKSQNPDLEVIIITGFGDISLAVKAMKQGAYDFIPKPIQHLSQIVAAAERALEKSAMRNEIYELRSRIGEDNRFESLIGNSLAMRRIYHRIAQVAPTDSTVLIQGKTGTGKELAALAIHARSQRANGPFIPINCGSLSEQLLESELFGHLKGAFTGAISSKIGLFEAATEGTIFLDEIDSMPPHTQVGLLRVLQDKQIRPIGSVSMRKIDVRIVASTQESLFKLTESGVFREDLYYRISSVIIALPLLKERGEDIPLLADHFLKIACQKASKEQYRLLPEAVTSLMNHNWPGNVRELENAMEHAVLFSQKPVITPADIQQLIQIPRSDQGDLTTGTEAASSAGESTGNVSFGIQLPTIEEAKDLLIEEALIRADGNKSAAAELLGMTRQSLNRRIKQKKS